MADRDRSRDRGTEIDSCSDCDVDKGSNADTEQVTEEETKAKT